jgi:hypothetical protein
MCCARTPLVTLEDGKQIAKEECVNGIVSDSHAIQTCNGQIKPRLLQFMFPILLFGPATGFAPRSPAPRQDDTFGLSCSDALSGKTAK